MRIVFMGTADFAVPALEAVAEHVVLVVAQPDRPSGRGLELKATPVKQKAIDLDLPVETPEKCRSVESIQRLNELQPDVLLVAAYGQILSTAVLETARYGGINLHGSLLPKYRGAAPIQRCLLNGETETGVTLMQMDKGMDTGNIISMEMLAIGADVTAGELFNKLSILAAQMAKEWLPIICSGDYKSVPQNNELATYAPKVEKQEGQLKFENGFAQEYNRFRAFSPFPGSFVKTKYGELKLIETKSHPGTEGQVGTVVQIRPDLGVQFGGGVLILRQVKPEGKKQMAGAEWANGVRIAVGDSLIG